MKSLNIKNQLKYFVGALAASGMLLFAGCDGNNNRTNNEQLGTEEDTRVGGDENQVGQPTRDNLSRENVNTEIYDEPVEGAKEDANESIDERQETQQRGSEERANQDTLTEPNQQQSPRNNHAADTAQ